MDRSFIFGEIRRLAQEDGGRPPGRIQFHSATQTRASDWANKPWNDWNNWGDVLEEAGFSRRSSAAKLDDAHMLQQLANLTRKLGRFPITADMRREKRLNKEFPNDKVFSETFGSRAQSLEALTKFSNDKTEYSDLLPILRNSEVSTGFKKSKNEVAEPKLEYLSTNLIAGYVYLFKADKQYKIGSSRAPYRRVSELINQSAFGGKPIHIISTDDPEGIERYWHKRFESSRIVGINKASGEWFMLSAADIAAFKRRKTM